MTALPRETLDALASMKDAIFGRPPTEHDYRGEPWDDALKALPKTCLLWKRYLEFDAARIAFEAMDETHRRWENELSAVNGRLLQANPDTTDADDFTRDFARGNLIQIALKEQHALYAELRTRRDEAEAAWQQVWSAYKALQTTTWRVRQEPRQTSAPGMASPYRDRLAELEHERRLFEAPQG